MGQIRFKFLHFTNTDFSFALPTSRYYAMIRFLRVRKLNEVKITEVYLRKAVYRKTATRQFLI